MTEVLCRSIVERIEFLDTKRPSEKPVGQNWIASQYWTVQVRADYSTIHGSLGEGSISIAHTSGHSRQRNGAVTYGSSPTMILKSAQRGNLERCKQLPGSVTDIGRQFADRSQTFPFVSGNIKQSDAIVKRAI